ncbi:MAG TPA: hypothetical protein VFY64_07215 [Nitrososphaeraceae archaeon]|nr:hypothetical protein [Nitrososphaeraceae archaeon]
MKKLASKRDNSNNVNNIVEHIGLSKFEKNPVIKPSDLLQQSKEAPRPLVPHPDVLYNQKKKEKEEHL